MTEKATRDAAAVKVLTIVALVYLPGTAVMVFLLFILSMSDTNHRGEFLLYRFRNKRQ